MKPTPASILHAVLLAIVTAMLVQSAWELPHRPYLGLALSGDLVASVDPGSPGERAGVLPGDRLSRPGPVASGRDPQVGIEPGESLPMDVVRAGQRSRVVLIPEALPDGERRLQTGLIALACAFVLLGGWVWSERRDGLTAAFSLLCLALASVLAGPPRATPEVAMVSAVLTTVMAFLLPALLVHFFALFPDFRAQGRRWTWVRAAYAVAALLGSVALVPLALQSGGIAVPDALADLPQQAASVWLLVGTLGALGLFGASYSRAGSADARRRLRVAFIGSLLGLIPFAGVIAVRGVAPGLTLPGERWAAGLLLLVPASFAWAIVVHRIFDFRAALRAGMTALLLGTIGLVLWAVGEWATARGMPQLSAPLTARTLIFLAVASALAGPTAPWIRSIGRRMVPEDDAPMTLVGPSAPAGGDGDALLVSAADLLSSRLRLVGCAVAVMDGDAPRPLAAAAGTPLADAAAALRWLPGGWWPGGPVGVDAAPVLAPDHDALAAAGVAWLLAVGRPVRAVLLLGRRMGGAWLDRRESVELERWAAHLAVSLENASLRRDATTHGALERELREAGAVQAHLLAQRVPVHPTLDCAALVLSCEPVGGDYFDFVEEPDRRFTLAVGDAAGKGMPAALLLAHVQARFRVMAGERSPAALLASLNRELVRFAQPEKFLGLACARVDVRAGRMEIAVGGLEPPLLRRASGVVEELAGGGGLLGVSESATFRASRIDLRAGDLVLLYTDGLTEARRGAELFGRDRLGELLAQLGHRRAEDIVAALVAEVRAFADEPLDDLTVVVLKQLAAPVRHFGRDDAEERREIEAQALEPSGRR